MRNRSLAVAIAVAHLPAAVAVAQHADSRPTAHDVAALTTASSAAISPDGQWVAYTVTMREFDADAKPSKSDSDAGWTSSTQIWLATADGSQPARQVTFADNSASSPSFSPDSSTLAFRRSVDGKSVIHLLPLTGGEAAVLDTGELSPGRFLWSPDGAQFAFAATPDDDEARIRQDWEAGGGFDWEDQWRNAVLYIVSADGGEPTPISDVERNVTNFAWAPDSERLAVATSMNGDPYEVFNRNSAHVMRASDGLVLQTIEDNPTAIGQMAFSPDGTRVAFTVTRGTLSVQNHLDIRDLNTGALNNAAASLDPTLGAFLWTGNDTLVAHAQVKTRSRLYELADDGSAARDLGFDGPVIGGGLSATADASTVAAMTSTPLSPPSPTVINLADASMTVVTDMSAEIEDWTGFNYEIVTWTNPEGDELEGLLAATPHSAPGVPPPLMVLPHGGPDSVTMESFSTWVHYFTARGFSVFRPNYRGGTAYGFDFYASNRGRLGEIEFMDIESGVDQLIADGRADPDRLVYGGWSWGGYLTAWTIGHTNRYQAAVAGAAITDVVAQYVGSDINHGVAAEWEYTGNPWQDTAEFDESDPVRFLAHCATPTLIIHGMNDARVPFNQGLTLYRALIDVGCETKFLAYPREPHGFREPAHTQHMLNAWAQWYLGRVSVD
jgi:dipeptidyl aminopeptidase/acylaminoacyl peptidase